MKIASNKLSELYKFYQSELSGIYDDGERDAIFALVCENRLGIPAGELRKHFEDKLNQSDLLLIYDAAKALKCGEPVQYILKEAFFYDRFFAVTPDVLIPRPETEELVDLILNMAEELPKPWTLLDIGTGSGCIPITLGIHLPGASVSAIDVSAAALAVAEANARKQGVQIQFRQLDVLDSNAFSEALDTCLFSLIVSNPPYIARSEAAQMEQHVVAREPHLALFVDDDDPIVFYKRIIDRCEKALQSGGYLFFELNPLFAFDVKNYADRVNLFNFAELVIDMSGKHRFLKAQRR